jgi:sulfur carrier protein ThiS
MAHDRLSDARLIAPPMPCVPAELPALPGQTLARVVKDFGPPSCVAFIVEVNGAPVLRADWSREIAPGDIHRRDPAASRRRRREIDPGHRGDDRAGGLRPVGRRGAGGCAGAVLYRACGGRHRQCDPCRRRHPDQHAARAEAGGDSGGPVGGLADLFDQRAGQSGPAFLCHSGAIRRARHGAGLCVRSLSGVSGQRPVSAPVVRARPRALGGGARAHRRDGCLGGRERFHGRAFRHRDRLL